MNAHGRGTLGLIGVIVFCAAALLTDSQAYAQHCGYGGYGVGYVGSYGHGGGYGYAASQPVWHGPSVHYDRRYHATSRHFTHRLGWHTHGHYDYVPHYVPGHYDRWHNGHIDVNPYYHR